MLQRQIDWILSVNELSGYSIYLVAQNYDDCDLEMLPESFIVFRYPFGIGPHRARNLLLEHFYESCDDWMLCMDDDIMVYDKYESSQIFYDILEPGKFRDVDMITGVYGRFQPYTHLNTNKSYIIDNYTFTPRIINSPGGLILYRNVNKYYGFQLWYSDVVDADGRFAGREDMDFLVDSILIINNLGDTKSTIFSHDKNIHDTQVRECLDSFIDKHKDLFFRKSNGTIDYLSFNRRYNKAKPWLSISRGVSIKVPQDDWFTVRHRVGKNRTHRLF